MMTHRLDPPEADRGGPRQRVPADRPRRRAGPDRRRLAGRPAAEAADRDRPRRQHLRQRPGAADPRQAAPSWACARRCSPTYAPGATDYAALIEQLRRRGIGLLYVGGYGPDAAGSCAPRASAAASCSWSAATGWAWRSSGPSPAPAGEGTIFTARRDLSREPGAAPVLAAFRALGMGPLPTGLGRLRRGPGLGRGGHAGGQRRARPRSRRPCIAAGSRRAVGRVAFDEKGDVEGADLAVAGLARRQLRAAASRLAAEPAPQMQRPPSTSSATPVMNSRVVGGQPQGSIGHVLGRAQPAQRHGGRRSGRGSRACRRR